MMKGISTLAAGTSLLALTMPMSARAQTAPPVAATSTGASAAQAANAEPALADIVVTAQRVEQSLNRVPISISVESGDALRRDAVSNLQDLALQVPNIQITQTSISSQIFIRGTGTGGDPAFEQSVAQYVDGVSYGRGSLTRAPFFDIQRVEVLRGPQSILFGKNSTAGALSLVTALPTRTMQAGITSTYTPRFGEIETEAFASGPVDDRLSARFALRYVHDDGFVYNTFKNRSEPEREEIAARTTLLYETPGALQFTLKGEYQKFSSEGRELEVVRDEATRTAAGLPLTYATGLALSGLPGVLPNTVFDYQRHTDFPEFDDTRFYNATLGAKIPISASTLSTTTGYIGYDRSFQVDLDHTSANLVIGAAREHYQQFTQEVRFVTPATEPLSVILGAYYEWNRLGYQDDSGFGSDLGKLGYGAIANIDVTRNFNQTSETFAGFGQATWRVLDGLRLVAGVRVSHDRKDASRRLLARVGQTASDGPLVTSPVQLAILHAGLGYDLDNPGSTGNNLSGTRGKTHAVPSATIEFDATPKLLLFGSYKQGYKAGGFDVRSNKNTGFGFDDETVRTFEGGFRWQVLNGRGSLGVTGYHNIFSNLQISQSDGSVGFLTGNAGRTRTQGVDADARFAVTRGLTANAGVSYLDFRYLDFRRGNCAFGQVPNGDVVNGVPLCDYTGKVGRLAPRWTLSGGLSYDRAIIGPVRLQGGVDATYRSAHNIHENLDPLGQVAGYALVNARLGLGGANWSAAVIVRNIFDQQYSTFASNVVFSSAFGANTQVASIGEPRSIGIQASLRY